MKRPVYVMGLLSVKKNCSKLPEKNKTSTNYRTQLKQMHSRRTYRGGMLSRESQQDSAPNNIMFPVPAASNGQTD